MNLLRERSPHRSAHGSARRFQHPASDSRPPIEAAAATAPTGAVDQDCEAVTVDGPDGRTWVFTVAPGTFPSWVWR